MSVENFVLWADNAFNSIVHLLQLALSGMLYLLLSLFSFFYIQVMISMVTKKLELLCVELFFQVCTRVNSWGLFCLQGSTWGCLATSK